MKRYTAFENLPQLTIGEVIEEIEKHGIYNDEGESKTISFDFGSAIPTDVGSWRGDYSELELGYQLTGYDSQENHLKETKAIELISLLKSAVGKIFAGWKGGEFLMNKDTPLWVSNAGNASHTAIVGVHDIGYKLIILTAYCEY